MVETIDKVCVVIISTVNVEETPDSYSEKRSGFSSQERFSQTLATIQSIRKFLPTAKILLIEGGKRTGLLDPLPELVDHYLFIGDNQIVRFSVDGKHKSLGEIVLSIFAWNELRKMDIQFVLKISGRYRMNETFDIFDWNFRKFNFRLANSSVSTRMYGFPKVLHSRWCMALVFAIAGAVRGKRLEKLLYKSLWTRERNYLDTLGLEGEFGPTRTPLTE